MHVPKSISQTLTSLSLASLLFVASCSDDGIATPGSAINEAADDAVADLFVLTLYAFWALVLIEQNDGERLEVTDINTERFRFRIKERDNDASLFRFVGNWDCNTFSVPVVFDGNTVYFEQGTSTSENCGNSSDTTDIAANIFLSAGSARLDFNDDEVIFEAGDGTRLVFRNTEE
ncbi:MAG: hypothetical protein CSB44_03090 [Gammaproteobacteria bacterium]|nr:MAG: hypothetical protein CSB44_03090 [Gammaproteobacteria bacterium]PIE36583.1 MAG: hypothetical protein CSA54_04080 [Gammaproteobacteria bacterium]